MKNLDSVSGLVHPNIDGFGASFLRSEVMTVSDDTKNGLEDCPRCGSLLPDPEEGVCLTCGYEYGRETLYMPVVTMDKIQQVKETPAEDSVSMPAAAPAQSDHMASGGASGQKTKLLVAFLAVSFMLMVVLVAIVALLLY